MTVFLPPELCAGQFAPEAFDRLAETVRKGKILGLTNDELRKDLLEQHFPADLVNWYLKQVELFGPELKIHMNRTNDRLTAHGGVYTRTTDSLAKTLIVIGASANALLHVGSLGGSLLLGLLGQPIGVAGYVFVAALFIRALDRRHKELLPRKPSRVGATLFLIGGAIALLEMGAVSATHRDSYGGLGSLAFIGGMLFLLVAVFLSPVQTTLFYLFLAWFGGGVPWYDWALVLPPIAFVAGFAAEADDKGHSAWWGLTGAFEIILPARLRPRRPRRVILI